MSCCSLEDIRQLPVGSTRDNVVIRLEDVATVTLAYPEESSYVTNGFSPLMLVEVMKRSDGNTLSIVSQIKEVLAEAEAEPAEEAEPEVAPPPQATRDRDMAAARVRARIFFIVFSPF